MTGHIRHRRWVWATAMLLVLGHAALVPNLSLSTVAQAPLWTERLPDVAPAPVPAPNWVELAKRAKPAVVNLSTKRAPDSTPQSQRDPAPSETVEQFLKQLLEGEPRRAVRAVGAGFVINPNGYILTNDHMVDGATEINVKLADGREIGATVVGRDSTTDLALLKIEATGLPVIPLGDSSELQVGSPVMAIGNPFGLEQTVTTGIVSATGRVIGEGPYDDFIQTDVAINPGSSGGPLINARGQAVGINSAIVTGRGGSVGINFAIPVNVAKPVVTQLAQAGHVERGWLGVSIQPLTPDLARSLNLSSRSGALVASVISPSPAMTAGIKPGDVITEYDGRTIERSEDLPRAVAETPVGRDAPMRVVREGKTLALTARIERLEEPRQRAAARSTTDQGLLGLTIESITPDLARQLGLPEGMGVVVREVQDSSPAAHAGIEAGDIIVEVDRHSVTSARHMKDLVDGHLAGAPLLMRVHRDGSNRYVAVRS
jgi:serine protease Do